MFLFIGLCRIVYGKVHIQGLYLTYTVCHFLSPYLLLLKTKTPVMADWNSCEKFIRVNSSSPSKS